MSVPTWPDVEARLYAELVALEDEEFVVVHSSAETAPAARRRWRPRARSAAHTVPTAQFLRSREQVLGEVVGGPLREPGTAHDAVGSLGWWRPGERGPAGERPSGDPRYWHLVPVADRSGLARLAGMGVAALVAMGAEPGDLTWVRDR